MTLAAFLSCSGDQASSPFQPESRDDRLALSADGPGTCKGQPTSPGVTSFTFGGVTTFIGTFGNDVIGGTNGVDLVLGKSGDDDICTYKGIDTVHAGAGDDEVFGGDDRDFLFGMTGEDQLFGEHGPDRLDGGHTPVPSSVADEDTDVCNGGTQNDTFYLCEVVIQTSTLATITVTPNPASMPTNATQQFTAIGRDGDGNIFPISPVWSVVNGGGGINANTGLFTAGAVTGTFTNTVRATQGTIFGTATVIVISGPLATITVTPNPVTLQIGGTQTFTAVGRDAGGNVVAINPTWSVTSGGGTIPAGTTGLTAPFTAGNTTGTFPNTVRATQGTIFGTATVTVISPPPPPPASIFAVLATQAVACTGGTIIGDVGTFQAAPTGSITPSCIPITTGTVHAPGDAASVTAFNNFLSTYNAFATTTCGTMLTGTLAGVTLAPGVYCFDAAAGLTGVLTLNGPSTGVWLFKIGTSGTGALTGTNFSVVMAGGAQACNVSWWVRQAATMTDSDVKGSILAGAGITLTRGTLNGDAWSQAGVTITGTAVTGCP